MNKPAKWKFNKARQNWLIRNIWSPENIPELYMPLVCKYLSEVQGGSREKLKASCLSVLNPEESKPEDESSKQTTDENEKQETAPSTETASPSKRKVTFGPLIAAPAPAPSTKGSLEVSAATSSTTDAKKLADINRSRAQTILDALK
ncbi:hypothetical protein BJ165DRAFT_1419601 [Panaeolus papilionaceus]|nr:hypothetical protein BJ165DRAFT_1419601 [Panaeolus papilionaceus]